MINILLTKIFVLKGIPSSILAVSPENLLRILPAEVSSKNIIWEFKTFSNKSVKINRELFKLLKAKNSALHTDKNIIIDVKNINV